MKFLSYDSPLVSILRRLIDYFLISLLWVIASVPIVTGGAAFVAALQTIRTSIQKDEGHVFSTFWEQFRAEFKQATVLWLLQLALSALLFLNFCLIRDNEMHILLQVPGYIAIVAVFLWIQLWFGYLSNFEDSIKTLLHNTFLMALSSLGRTLLASILPIVFVIAGYISFLTVSPLLFVLPACYLALYARLMKKLFSRYLSTEEEKALTETF